jgi:hypothetical protein
LRDRFLRVENEKITEEVEKLNQIAASQVGITDAAKNAVDELMKL